MKNILILLLLSVRFTFAQGNISTTKKDTVEPGTRRSPEAFKYDLLQRMDLPESDWLNVAYTNKEQLVSLLINRGSNFYSLMIIKIGWADLDDLVIWLKSTEGRKFLDSSAKSLDEYVYYEY